MATIQSLLRDRVSLRVESVDRLFLQGYVSRLVTRQQVIGFLRGRGFPIASPAAFGKIGRSPTAAPTPAGCSCRPRRCCGSRSSNRVELPGDPPRPPRPWPAFPEVPWEKNRIWIWDASHFPAARRVAYAIVDVVTRYWIGYLLSVEQSSTPAQLLFARALAEQGLDGAEGGGGPVLVAWSDNGPEMTAADTRELMALMAIAQHHGRPAHRPTSAHRELLQPPQGRLAPPRRDRGPGRARPRARPRPRRVQPRPQRAPDDLRLAPPATQGPHPSHPSLPALRADPGGAADRPSSSRRPTARS